MVPQSRVKARHLERDDELEAAASPSEAPARRPSRKPGIEVRRGLVWAAWVASVAVHAAVAIALRPLAARHAAEASVAHTVPEPGGGPLIDGVTRDGVTVAETSIDVWGPVPPRPAGQAVAHLDDGAPGRGGDIADRTPALNLADTNERMRLSPDLVDRLDRDQLQRLRVSRARASWEDRRATTHPAELSLVATGPGTVHERRSAAPVEPSRGQIEARRASERGATATGGPAGAAPLDDFVGGTRTQGAARLGSLSDVAGPGLRQAPPSVNHPAAVPVGDARPAVTRAPVAVPAALRDRPIDDVESDQEVATTVQSLVHASSAGGIAGEGQGGSGGGGIAAAGGITGATSHARLLGTGDGDAIDYFTDDPELLPYFRQIHHRIDPLWVNAFPKSALLDLKQGTVILEFTIFADGRAVVSWPPTRPSGVDEFDRNCADAIRHAAPFPPIPRSLGVAELHIRAPFVANNPIIK